MDDDKIVTDSDSDAPKIGMHKIRKTIHFRGSPGASYPLPEKNFTPLNLYLLIGEGGSKFLCFLSKNFTPLTLNLHLHRRRWEQFFSGREY